MARNLIFELSPDVSDRLRRLTALYGESSPSAMIARALGLLEIIEPYLHDGLLTVIDPDAHSDQNDEREVDLLFEPRKTPSQEHYAL